jgi:hypothetical protein
VLEELDAHLTATLQPPPPPEEYEIFQLCLALGCLPKDIEELDEATYQQFRQFMRMEESAGKLKGLQRQLYG